MAYKRSVFPDAIDTLDEVFDLPSSLKDEAVEYSTLRLIANPTSEQTIRLNELTSLLSDYIITPETMNKRDDMMIGMQLFFRDEVQGYIDTKQSEFDASLAKFTDKGAYNNSTTYDIRNTVTYNYESYMSLQSNNLNNTPDVSPSYWSKIASRGMQGLTGINLVPMGNYNNAIPYTVNQAVSYNGTMWYCIQNTTGNAPAVGSTYWAVFQANVAPVIQQTQPSSPASGLIWIDLD